MDADLLFCRVMADRLLESPAPNCLLVDDRLVDTGEEVKVVAGSNGMVCGLGKQVRREGTVVGESVGIYKFSADTNNKLITGLRLAVAENPKVEYEAVIDSLLEHIEMRYVPVGDLSWIEIDFAADVDRANTETWAGHCESGEDSLADRDYRKAAMIWEAHDGERACPLGCLSH